MSYTIFHIKEHAISDLFFKMRRYIIKKKWIYNLLINKGNKIPNQRRMLKKKKDRFKEEMEG